eukprot:jgi/Tetstr1/457269/TSEL_004196.t1
MGVGGVGGGGGVTAFPFMTAGSGKVTVQSGWVIEDCWHHSETFSLLTAGPLLEEARVKAIMTGKELASPAVMRAVSQLGVLGHMYKRLQGAVWFVTRWGLQNVVTEEDGPERKAQVDALTREGRTRYLADITVYARLAEGNGFVSLLVSNLHSAVCRMIHQILACRHPLAELWMENLMGFLKAGAKRVLPKNVCETMMRDLLFAQQINRLKAHRLYLEPNPNKKQTLLKLRWGEGNEPSQNTGARFRRRVARRQLGAPTTAAPAPVDMVSNLHPNLRLVMRGDGNGVELVEGEAPAEMDPSVQVAAPSTALPGEVNLALDGTMGDGPVVAVSSIIWGHSRLKCRQKLRNVLRPGARYGAPRFQQTREDCSFIFAENDPQQWLLLDLGAVFSLSRVGASGYQDRWLSRFDVITCLEAELPQGTSYPDEGCFVAASPGECPQLEGNMVVRIEHVGISSRRPYVAHTARSPPKDDLFQQAMPLGNTAPRNGLKDMVPDAELSFSAFNAVTGSYDSRSLKPTLQEFKTMRDRVKYTAVPRAMAVDQFEHSLLGDMRRGLAVRDAAWHNTEP